ncbi:isoleucine--tRNA ligase [Mycolicibacterium fortuitum]|uniref:Isoleucine--tRNA ligase n=1 Tax=Mycolicibacterium fortuitum subsp. fortuitum DSM 46621 = ATCC 6841 = JCM 6387 TaxID=1214102 RepID=K0VDC2_MYCFO|nr:isoleucine--tRNA ligase [Mycolicibacterium fortuitum]AIY46568.1 Isoleucyl-tRNA synthetase [Mycobacterium sp. VKM Ac-1817D]CRL69752.1 isoleucyl-tRNA synthetase [Mycolicibacter nonchromogenicus]EJZ15725.1 isoleucyl-tRNA ligase [Mycolicibacterium fortuitum subsp. fortuitum DSM 46621 = ATCC 6841 = JCM 6387]WEV35504.1 isoleucine--tRNA ligase [Mycolicibacterium fortuitum]CRL56530.1 isoleucyl-tRNA synthetase [Mycolicibacterium fortuitum subsp. fortuitum DSM 46621 = ATCC 6841 = JCM 6387]
MTAPSESSTSTGYPKPAAPNFPERELEVLDYWAADDTFRASIARREGAEEYVFYDGPPFANGLPHYGHLLTGYVKDIVPRFRTMRGYKVERRFGWDTHGLPAELEVQRQLGIADKAQIEEMGIEKFNAACRASVLKYTDEWQAYVTRQARWVDFDNDYKTLDPTFMESVIWAFKQLWDKGLAYEGNRVLPYCWNDETPLSNHELRMDDDVYQSRQDPAVTVGFTVPDGPLKGAHLLIWTTTPWTLPSNQAVAVNPGIDYVLVQGSDGRRYVLAQARLAAYARELGEEPEVLGSYTGRDLLGTKYLPPFPYFMDAPNSFQVLAADFVSTEDGTGIVHMAPAYGEDDKATADTADIVAVTPVDSKGRFDSTVPDYAGLQVFEANSQIIRDLKNGDGPAAANGAVLLRHETYEHSYPHCWRCRNPLIYRAVSSWFIKVTEFRDRMVELNQQITWYPEHVKDGQFGKWLSNARDWSVSRNRYWGSPIPVWKSDDPTYPRIDVYGSLDELERDFGVRPTDLHRPFIDQLTRPNPDDPTGKSTMRRIEDVFDVWFDSGSMPYAQVHYPFENQQWFDGTNAEDAHFPGDFIVEYIGQTRGWFYTMHVLATALFDKPAFKTCVAHGIVLGNDGQKMSKSLRNYPDVSEVFDRDGSDAMRWFLMASPILRGGNLIVTEQGIREGVRQVLLPLWNAYSFLALYAPKKGTWRTDSANVLDRYILAKLAQLRDDLTEALDTCDISGACDELRQFTEALTNWYVRRSRSRFWEEDADAIDTLHTVLEITCRLAAPLLPLATEVIWRGLTGERSVHLTDWPEAGVVPHDAELVAAMDQVREVCSVGSSLRKAKKLRVRLPLPKLTVAVDHPAALVPFADLIADELNVKAVDLTDDIDTYGKFDLAVNARVAGPRIGKDVQAAIKAVKAGEGVVNPDGTLTAGPVVLQPEEYTAKLVAADPEWTAALPDGAGLVVLDGTVTEELEAEGWAKDRIRELQELRKSTGLEVSDRIAVKISVPAQYERWARTHRDLIAGEILATSFEFVDTASVSEGSVIGDGVRVSITKA